MDLIILKKIITTLLYPASLILFAAFLSILFKVIKKTKLSQFCFLFSALIFVLSSNPMFARGLVYSLERHYPQKSIEVIKPHDAIIVLGGGLRIPTLPAKHTQLSSGSDRYWYAVQLYRAGKGKQIIISAGNIVEQNGLDSEAVYAKELLELWGVPSTSILIETKSRTTHENKQQIASLLERHSLDSKKLESQKNGGESISSALLVTSALHMPRAFSLFEELPILITPASADVLIRDTNSISLLNWLPSVNAMQLTTIALHEYYAIWYGRLKALIFKF